MVHSDSLVSAVGDASEIDVLGDSSPSDGGFLDALSVIVAQDGFWPFGKTCGQPTAHDRTALLSGDGGRPRVGGLWFGLGQGDGCWVMLLLMVLLLVLWLRVTDGVGWWACVKHGG